MGNKNGGQDNFSNINTLDVYVINLNQRPDRMGYMDNLLRREGLVYKRVSAVYGKKFYNITDICSSEGYPDLACMGGDDRTGHLSHAGCYLSHLKCLKMASEGPTDRVLVLEDDIKFIVDNQAANVLRKIVEENAGIDFIWLNASKGETEVIERKVMPSWGSQAYIVNKKAAKILYSMLKPGSQWSNSTHNCLLDWALFLAVKDAKLRWTNIRLVCQNDELGSNIRES